MEPNNGLSGAKIALLVDFDNVVLGLEDPGFDIELVVNALRERGTIVLGRVYGDWYRHNRHRRKLMEQGLELVETPAFGPVIKNSADIRIALDGFEIGLTQSHIDTFAIVSGDSDFLPLIKKLQSLGRRVLVICGNRFTSDMLRRNCNEFISYENLLAQSVGATEDATTFEGAFSLLHRAMAALRERGTEIRGSGVKQMMIQLNPVFSERTFGCTQFRQFLQKAVNAGIVKLGPRDKTSGEFHVLLPDEDEAPVQQKFERRQENRARREDKIAQIAARIEAVPVPTTSVEDDEISVDLDALATPENDFIADETEFEGGAVFADDAFGFDPEPMSQAMTTSPQEIAQNTIARTELLSRGLRPSNRVFSGRAGRPALDVDQMEPTSFEMDGDDETPETEIEVAPLSEVEAPVVETAQAPAIDTRRLRSRRRRRSASGQITVVSDEATPDFDSTQAQDESAPEAQISAPATQDEVTPQAPDLSGNVTIEFSHEPLNATEESRVEDAEQVEAPADAVSEIQTALDELSSETGEPTQTTEPLAPSKGVEVEADAPALPEGTPEVDASAPSGVPLAVSEAAKPKRRRAPRSKTKAAPVLAEEIAPTPELTDIPAEDLPVFVEEVAAVQSAPEPEVQAPVESATEAQIEAAPEAETAPAKPKRRRPSRAKKTDAAPTESSE